MAGLGPLLFLSCRSGRRWVQRYLCCALERGGIWVSGYALVSAESWQAEGWERQVQASRAVESAQA